MLQETPGIQLKNYLQSLYPKAGIDDQNVYNRIDADFFYDGNLSAVIYSSALNHLLRRLVKTADYFRRMPPAQNIDSVPYRERMKAYFRNHTDFDDKTINELIVLLRRCLAVSPHISDGTRNRLLRSAKSRSFNCYLCGTTIDYEHDDQQNSYTLDHHWPNSLGGFSTEDNLSVSCANCNNNLKGDFIDGSDYHYEHICFQTTTYSEFEQLKQYTPKEAGRYELAIFAKSNHQCSVCAKPASIAGKLFVDRISPDDSWHFFNLTAYCTKHRPRP